MNYIFTSCLSIHLFVPWINLQPKLETVWVGETHVSFCATAEIKPEALIGQGSNRRGGTCTPVIHTRTSTQFFSHPASPSALPCTKAHSLLHGSGVQPCSLVWSLTSLLLQGFLQPSDGPSLAQQSRLFPACLLTFHWTALWSSQLNK